MRPEATPPQFVIFDRGEDPVESELSRPKPLHIEEGAGDAYKGCFHRVRKVIIGGLLTFPDDTRDILATFSRAARLEVVVLNF